MITPMMAATADANFRYTRDMELSQRDARKLFLKQQGLLNRSEFGQGKHGVNRAIARLSYLQIDTISVVNRAHEHVLYNRVDNYHPRLLEKLTREREVFEYWSHAAAFLPFTDYRYSLPVMKGWSNSRACDRKLARAIIDRIRAEGPLQSRDFEDTSGKQRGGWWEWKPAKKVLEHLFLSGELMVTRRDGFQKVFDLKDNVIPAHIDTSEPSLQEWSDFIVLRMIEALGVATEYDIGYAKATVRRLAKIGLKEPIQNTLRRLVAEGHLVEISVMGRVYFSTTAMLDQLPLKVNRKTVRLLSPFDNLVINRRRTNELFNFDYVLECYLPEEKRQYGYFVLPLLYGDELIGRLDAKADRKQAELQVRNLVLEPGTSIDPKLVQALAAGICDFARDHDCSAITLQRLQPDELAAPLRAALEER